MWLLKQGSLVLLDSGGGSKPCSFSRLGSKKTDSSQCNG